MTKITNLPLAAIIAGALIGLGAGPAFAQSNNVPEQLDEIIELLNAQQDAIEELQEAADDSDKLLAPKTIFLSSSRQKGNFGGLAQADQICQGLADAPGSIVPPGEYVALLSTDSVQGAARLTPSSGPYVRPDGAVVAANFAALFSTDNGEANELIVPANVDELGNDNFDVDVWTGTRANGTTQTNSNCQNWTSDADGDLGNAGLSLDRDGGWLDLGALSCDRDRWLYCVQR